MDEVFEQELVSRLLLDDDDDDEDVDEDEEHDGDLTVFMLRCRSTEWRERD